MVGTGDTCGYPYLACQKNGFCLTSRLLGCKCVLRVFYKIFDRQADKENPFQTARVGLVTLVKVHTDR